MKITATGDALFMKRLTSAYDTEFNELRSFIMRGDARLNNLETVIADFDISCAAYSGGTWLCARPQILDEIKKYGIMYCSTANNHSHDYGIDGLRKTIAYLDEKGLKHSGTGESLEEAGKPAIIDTPDGSLGVIAITTTYDNTSKAGSPTPVFPARPGVNYVGFSEKFYVTWEQLQSLKQIAADTYLNGALERSIGSGYAQPPKEGETFFGKYTFEVGSQLGRMSVCKPKDLHRIVENIKNTLKITDYAVVYIHSHEMARDKYTEPDHFLVELARACIDAGACAVIGGGTHQLLPMEMYKGCPIFYSLGDFIYQGMSVEHLPADFLEKFDMPLDTKAYDALYKRSRGGTVGLHKDYMNYRTLIPFINIEKGKLTELELLPVELNFDEGVELNGLPRAAKGELAQEIFEHFKSLCKGYCVDLCLENDIIKVKF